MPLSIGLAGGIVCGADTGSPVWDKYKPPFKFTGTLHRVTVDVSGELIKDEEADAAHASGAAVKGSRRKYKSTRVKRCKE